MSKSATNENLFIRIAKYLFPWKGDKIGEIIRKLVFIAAAVVLIVSVSLILNDTLQRKQMNDQDQDLADQFHHLSDNNNNSNLNNSNSVTSDETSSTPSDSSNSEVEEEDPGVGTFDFDPRDVQEQFLPLLKQNPETIGWLTIQGTNTSKPWIDYVVMQTDDNDKYLNYNFYGQKKKSGALFVDYDDKITPTHEPGNIVVYGHNMASGEYFGNLPAYFNYGMKGRYGRKSDDPNDIDWYKTHPTVEFSTLYKTSTYKVFACMMLNTEKEAGEVFNYYLKHNFKDRDDFNEYVGEILDRSTFYNPDVNVTYGDQLLTLSTCMWGYGKTDLRFVLFARETREGESPEVDVSKAYANPNPKFYELYYQIYDYTWEGRKWDKNLLLGYKEKDEEEDEISSNNSAY